MSTIFTSGTQLLCPEWQVESFLAKPRNTQSARSMNERRAQAVATTLAASEATLPSGEALCSAPTGAEQLRAIFCGLSLQKQDQLRLLAYHRIVLEAKMAAMLQRLEGEHEWGAEEGDLDMGTGGNDALHRLQRAVEDNQTELVRAVGVNTTKAVLRAVWAPDMQDALKLSIMSEEESRELLASTHDEYVAVTALAERGMEALRGGSISTRGATNLLQAQERAARLWRRRLWKITIPVRIDAKLRFATAHDDYDNRGRRSLVNDLNRRNPDAALSYCACLCCSCRLPLPQLCAHLCMLTPNPTPHTRARTNADQTAAKTYGRAGGRRGSTTISGGLLLQVLEEERRRTLEAAAAGAGPSARSYEDDLYLAQLEQREAELAQELAREAMPSPSREAAPPSREALPSFQPPRV